MASILQVGAAAGGEYRANVTSMLASMQRMGLKVLRTWAFNDGSGWQALQTSPGASNETVIRCADKPQCLPRHVKL